MSEHCSKCCEEKSGPRFIAGLLIVSLTYWALSYLLPEDWSTGQHIAATFILVGLMR